MSTTSWYSRLFSRYPEVIKMTSTTSLSIITALKAMFSWFGIPEIVRSDNGPQFSSAEFAEFATSYGFIHQTSSPLFPQSNGQAERTVQTIKHLLRRSKDQYMALLTYCLTPLPWCDLSPAELLMGRRMQNTLRQTKEQLIPSWGYLPDFRKKDRERKLEQKHNYDTRHQTRDLPLIPDDSQVWIQSGSQPQPGRVVSSAGSPRSYIVATPSSEVRHNRQHLGVIPPSGEQALSSKESERVPAPTRIMARSQTGTVIKPPERFA